jgi:pimeloyl-ACP methyl ester carboxylesterase
VVLVHGTMDRSSSFGRVAKALEGCRTIRYDRRGYARSLELGPPESFGQQVDDLLEVVRSEADGPAVVFGHSYGGTIALAAAATDPGRIAGVVAFESPLPWLAWWPGDSAGADAVAGADDPEAAGEAFMRRMVGDRRWERLPPSTRQARRAEGATLVAEIAQLRPPHPTPVDLGAVGVPVVAAHGTQGAAHHQRAAQEVAARVPGAHLAVVEGSGHGVHLTHPAAAASLVRELVARVR